jgi:hypothetical protein
MAVNYDSWESLYGKELEKVEKIRDEPGVDTLIFSFTDGTRLKFYHEYECCENVFVAGYVFSTPEAEGFTPYYGRPLLSITESSLEGYRESSIRDVSYTRTTFTFKWGESSQTFKGDEGHPPVFEIHWLGVSNGYYSETVSYNIRSGSVRTGVYHDD